MKRIFHPVDTWEEMEANMWGEVVNRKSALDRAIEFTGDHRLYGRWMLRVVKEWKFSCENSLTDLNLNRRAWVGHAAVAMALGIPEDITRLAWAKLSDEQQLLANREAERAIALWEQSHREDRTVQDVMDDTLL